MQVKAARPWKWHCLSALRKLECLAKWGTSRCSYKKVKARHVLKLIKSTNGERDTDTSWIMIVYA